MQLLFKSIWQESYLSSESWRELKISLVVILWQIMLKYYCFCSENQDEMLKVTLYEAIIQFFCLNCNFQKLLCIFYLRIKWLWKGTGTHIEFQQIERMLVVRKAQGWMLKKKLQRPTLTTCWIKFRQRCEEVQSHLWIRSKWPMQLIGIIRPERSEI